MLEILIAIAVTAAFSAEARKLNLSGFNWGCIALALFYSPYILMAIIFFVYLGVQGGSFNEYHAHFMVLGLVSYIPGFLLLMLGWKKMEDAARSKNSG